MEEVLEFLATVFDILPDKNKKEEKVYGEEYLFIIIFVVLILIATGLYFLLEINYIIYIIISSFVIAIIATILFKVLIKSYCKYIIKKLSKENN